MEAVRKKLESWVNEAETKDHPGASWRHLLAAEVVQALVNSRHPEFVPLLLRVLQWEKSGFDTFALCNTVYDSYPDPTSGYLPLRSLYTEGSAATAKVILDYWWHQESYYSSHQYILRTLNAIRSGKPIDKHLGNRRDLVYEGFMKEVTYWSNARAHSNSRLTPDQHRDLQGLDNVWLRAGYWQKFPTHCSPFWAAWLYSDLKRAVAPPDEKVIRAIADGLADDRYAIRERASRRAMELDDRILPGLRD